MNNSSSIFSKRAVWLSLLLGVLTVLAISSAAFALSNEFYDDNGSGATCDVGRRGRDAPTTTEYDISACNDNHRVVLLAGENNDVPIERTYIQANFFNGRTDAPPTGQSITIKGAHLCMNGSTLPNNRRDGVRKGYYSDNTVTNPNTDKIRDDNLNGSRVTRYKIGEQTEWGRFRAGAATDDCTSATDINVSLSTTRVGNSPFGDFQPVPGVPGAWFVTVYAAHWNKHGPATDSIGSDCPAGGNGPGTNGPCDGLVNGFSVQARGNKAVAVTMTAQDVNCAAEGRCATLRARDGETNADFANYFTYKARFGAPCTIPAGGEPAQIRFYDLDYGVNSTDAVIKLTVRDEAPDGSVRWLWGFQTSGGGYANSDSDWVDGDPAKEGRSTRGVWRNVQPTYHQSFQIRPNNGGVSSWGFDAEAGHDYVMYVQNVGPHLAMQIGIPYDGAYSVFDCPDDGSVTPQVGFDGDPDSYEPGDIPVATARITKNSPVDVEIDTVRYFWYESDNDRTFDPGDDPIHRVPNGHRTLNSPDFPLPSWGAAPGATADEIVANKRVPEGRSSVCTSLWLDNPLPANTRRRSNPAVHCVPIEKKPYLSVSNGDVNTTKAEVEECTYAGNANHIATYWRLEGGVNQGSRTELAAFAGGNVVDFISAALRSVAPTPKKGLTFANTGAGIGDFGGAYGTAVGCNNDPDWTAPATPGANNPLNSYPGGGGTRIYNGNLTISGNVRYPGGNFSLTNMPYLKVVIRGDIYIDKGVSEIDGIYMATGTIYTCTNGSSLPNAANYLTYLKDHCANRTLTVNGSLIANKIRFWRLSGGLRTNPAETITYDPLNWLKELSQDDDGPTEFDSYTIMPPVL